MIVVNKISKLNFENSSNILIFKDDNYNRCFGEIVLNDKGFKLGWNSDLLTPNILCLSIGIYAIGIDTNIAIINFNNMKILKLFQLSYNFCDFLLYQEHLYIISELEIIKVKNEDYSVINYFHLVDIYTKYIINDNKVFIKSMDNSLAVI